MDTIIVENFASQIANGMAVYDANGDKIGTVQQYDPTTGWFQTEKGIFSPHDRYIPFSAIDHIGPTGIYLSATRDYVEAMYGRPPGMDVEVVAGGAGTAVVGKVASGYDGSRVVVDSTTVRLVMAHMVTGPKVYDSDGKEVGRVYQYDEAGGWIVVEKGRMSPKDLFIPVTAVEYLDGDGVHLRVTKEVLKEAFVVKPAGVTPSPASTSTQSRG